MKRYHAMLAAITALTLWVLSSHPAFAHTEVGVQGGFFSGLSHPVFGLDHLVAMVGVGLWGAQLGSPAIWVLPIAFPAVMAIGGLLGVLGIPLPAVEVLIAGSAVVLGVMVAFAARPPLLVAAAIVAGFAIFHGHAHGTELPEAANALAYGVGFVLATGLLHLCGIIIGMAVMWPIGARAVQLCGALIALLGCYFVADWAGLIA